jgi:hypothetical protein
VKYFGILKKGGVRPEMITEIFGGSQQFDDISASCNWFASASQADLKSSDEGVTPGPAAAIAATKIPAAELPATTESSSPSTPPNQGDRFWIFVGTYKAVEDKWLSKYITILENLLLLRTQSREDIRSSIP